MTDPVIIPITDELDLHTFHPGQVPDLLNEYFSACLDREILVVRLIHGKGTGALKKRVRQVLAGDPRVVSVQDAPPASGGWGVTLVSLTPDPDSK